MEEPSFRVTPASKSMSRVRKGMMKIIFSSKNKINFILLNLHVIL